MDLTSLDYPSGSSMGEFLMISMASWLFLFIVIFALSVDTKKSCPH